MEEDGATMADSAAKTAHETPLIGMHAEIEILEDVQKVEESDKNKRMQHFTEVQNPRTKAQNDEGYRNYKYFRCEKSSIYDKVSGRYVEYKWMPPKKHKLNLRNNFLGGHVLQRRIDRVGRMLVWCRDVRE